MLEFSSGMFGADPWKLISTVGTEGVSQMMETAIKGQSPEFDKSYLGVVKDAVAQARRAGFSVILSLQWEGRTGVKPLGWSR